MELKKWKNPNTPRYSLEDPYVAKNLADSIACCLIGNDVVDCSVTPFALFVSGWKVKAVLSGVTETATLRRDQGEIVELVVSCKKWIPRVKEFTLKYPANPTVVISCPLEAALYAELKPRLDVLEDRCKTQHLLGKDRASHLQSIDLFNSHIFFFYFNLKSFSSQIFWTRLPTRRK